MKKSKATKNYKYIFLIVLALLVVAVFVTMKNLKPFYKVVDRSLKIKEERKKRDEEIIGWIRVQGTNIDYPIVNNDPEQQIDISDLQYDFAWINADPKGFTNRPVIVGHNILNVSSNPLIADKTHSRFEQLLSYVYTDFVRDNKYIEYSIDGKNYLYKMFSIAFVDDDTIDYFSQQLTKKEMKKYIENSKKESIYDFDVEANEKDNIITLLTCTRMFGNSANMTFKIDARMVRKNEAVTNYRVTENSSYKNIKEIMEGAGENETSA